MKKSFQFPVIFLLLVAACKPNEKNQLPGKETWMKGNWKLMQIMHDDNNNGLLDDSIKAYEQQFMIHASPHGALTYEDNGQEYTGYWQMERSDSITVYLYGTHDTSVNQAITVTEMDLVTDNYSVPQRLYFRKIY